MIHITEQTLVSLKCYLRKHGILKKDLATHIGISQPLLSRLLNRRATLIHESVMKQILEKIPMVAETTKNVSTKTSQSPEAPSKEYLLSLIHI